MIKIERVKEKLDKMLVIHAMMYASETVARTKRQEFKLEMRSFGGVQRRESGYSGQRMLKGCPARQEEKRKSTDKINGCSEG